MSGGKRGRHGLDAEGVPPLPAGEGWGEGEAPEHPVVFARRKTSHVFTLTPTLSLGGRERLLIACSPIRTCAFAVARTS